MLLFQYFSFTDGAVATDSGRGATCFELWDSGGQRGGINVKCIGKGEPVWEGFPEWQRGCKLTLPRAHLHHGSTFNSST